MPTPKPSYAGEIDIGADVKNLSQYPNESEVVFSPLANIEVEGKPIHEKLRGSNGLVRDALVIDARVNANSKNLTREELEAKRQELLISSLNNSLLEIKRDLKQMVSEGLWQNAGGPIVKSEENANKIMKLIIQEVQKTIKYYNEVETGTYLDDATYQLALQDAAVLPRVAKGKFKYWQKSDSVNVNNFKVLSMWKVEAMNVGQQWVEYREEREQWVKHRKERSANKGEDDRDDKDDTQAGSVGDKGKLVELAHTIVMSEGLVPELPRKDTEKASSDEPQIERSASGTERGSIDKKIDTISGVERNTALIRMLRLETMRGCSC